MSLLTNPCPACNGAGSAAGRACPICQGDGVLAGLFKPCPSCDGTGQVGESRCYRCKGVSLVTAAITYDDAEVKVLDLSRVDAHLRDHEPLELWERGLLSGLLVLDLQQAMANDLEPGEQLAAIIDQGGTLSFAPNGVWHRVDADVSSQPPAARVYTYVTWGDPRIRHG